MGHGKQKPQQEAMPSDIGRDCSWSHRYSDHAAPLPIVSLRQLRGVQNIAKLASGVRSPPASNVPASRGAARCLV